MDQNKKPGPKQAHKLDYVIELTREQLAQERLRKSNQKKIFIIVSIFFLVLLLVFYSLSGEGSVTQFILKNIFWTVVIMIGTYYFKKIRNR